MTLLSALALTPGSRELISIVGAGGKTTVMFNLAHALKKMGRKVLVTTTTNIFHPEPGQCDSIRYTGTTPIPVLAASPGTVTCLGRDLDPATNKIKGVDPEFIHRLFEKKRFDCILVEADGAKRKPIKAPAPHEPVVPAGTTLTLGVIGLDAMGKNIDDAHVHRLSNFCQITRTAPGTPVTEETIRALIRSENGIFKNAPPGRRRVVILNKADQVVLTDKLKRAFKTLAEANGQLDIILASARHDRVLP